MCSECQTAIIATFVYKCKKNSPRNMRYPIIIIISILINLSQSLIGQELIKSDSLSFMKAGRLNLRYEIFDSIGKDCVLTPPKYPLGGDHLGNYLSSGKYPPYEDSTELVEGTVNISFTIDKDGSVKNILIKNSLNDFIKNDLITLISKLFRFDPARCNGKPVQIRLNYNLTYRFR